MRHRTTLRLFLTSALLTAGLSACRPAASATAPQTRAPAASHDEDAPVGTSERVPLLRLSEHSGWSASALEIPTFTLYEDGLVLFARGEGADTRAMQVRLSREQTDALLEQAHAALGEMPEKTILVPGRDVPIATLGVTYRGRIYSVSMQGFSADETRPAPEPFAELYDALAGWDHPDAQPWTPDELVISMFRVDDEPTHAWPRALPLPPEDAREPAERVISHKGTTIRQPIRYRVSGSLEASLPASVPPLRADLAQGDTEAAYARVIPWNGASWHVRYDRVVPARTWFW